MPDRQRLCVGYAYRSDPGRDPDKQVNEDACIVGTMQDSLLAVVCDGMGGHHGGQLASRTAAETICSVLAAESSGTANRRATLRQAIVAASSAVYRIGGQLPDHQRPGATCVAALLHPGGLEVAHVGDSRCYRWRDHRLEPMTRDHSMIEDWIQAGRIQREVAHLHPDAHRITRALGIQPTVEVELRQTDSLRFGDRLLLCSDGLTDLVTDQELAEILASPGSLGALNDVLLALANDRGGHDNITAVLIGVMEATQSLQPSAEQPDAFHVISTSFTAPTEQLAVRPAYIEQTLPLRAVDRTAIMVAQPATTTDSAQLGHTGRLRTQPLDRGVLPTSQPSKASPLALAIARRYRARLRLLGLALVAVGIAVAVALLHC